MRKLFLFVFLISGCCLTAQEKQPYSLEFDYFKGSIIEHNPGISHLITDYPEGMVVSFNRKSYGREAWERRYNYPDVGVTFSYQDLKNPYLGENYGLYAHLGFYLLNRHLQLKVGQGLAYATNPYHPDSNYQNNAYGSPLLSSTYLGGRFHVEDLVGGIGFHTGLSLIHYSNADFRSPNSSTNTLAVSLGLNYLFDRGEQITYIPKDPTKRYTEPFRYNLVLRSGVNSARIIGTGSFPFLTISAYMDKTVSHKSTLQAGAEVFFSRSMEEYIKYRAAAFPLMDTTGDEDARRVGVFLGHQLKFNKLSVITHLGYYAYYPYDRFVDRVYNRVGLQRQIYKDLFGSVTVRSHGANAEAMEFSLGYRL